jgi:hypothetical protein
MPVTKTQSNKESLLTQDLKFNKNKMKCQVFSKSRKQSCIITCINNRLGTNLLAEATVMKKKANNIDVMILLKSDEIVT